MKKALALLLSIVLVISSVTCALVFPTSAEGENLWTDPTVGFTCSRASSVLSYITSDPYVSEPCYRVTDSYWCNFSFQLPSNLSADKLYRISFDYNFFPEQHTAVSDGTDKVNGMYLRAKNAETESYTDYGEKFIASATQVEFGWNTVTYEFDGTADQLYLYVNTQYIYYSYFRNFSLVEVPTYDITVTDGTADASHAKAGKTVTLSFDDANNTKIFKKWEIVSGDVTLADATAATTTFTMPAEAVEIQAVYKENLWSSFSTACYSQSVGDSSLTGPDSSGIYSVSGTMWYRTHKFALPLLENGKLYRLSFDYRIRQGNNGSNAIQSLTLSVPSENGSSIFGETATDYTWQTIEHQFTGISDQIYLTLATNHADIIQLRNISIIEQQANTDAIETAYNSAAALRVAANSSTGKNGLRVYNEIKTEWSDSVNIVEFGSIAVREALMQTNTTLSGLAEAGKPTLAMKDAGVKGVGVGVAYSKDDGISNLWGTTDGTVQFTSYLTGIKPEYYGDNYLIRTYAIDADGTVYYGDAIAVSVFDVANAMDHGQTADGSEATEADEAAFAAFITEDKKDEYATWCGTAGVGDLYNKYYGEVTAE